MNFTDIYLPEFHIYYVNLTDNTSVLVMDRKSESTPEVPAESYLNT